MISYIHNDYPWGSVRLVEHEGEGVIVEPKFTHFNRDTVHDMYAKTKPIINSLGYDWCCFYTTKPKMVELIFKILDKPLHKVQDVAGYPVYFHGEE